MKPPGLVFFAFNRPDLTERCLAALAGNTLAAECGLTVYCDAPRNAAEVPLVEATRNIARAAGGFKSLSVVERKKNHGCAASVIRGVTESFREHEALAIFEDDVLCSPHTLAYLTRCLEKYTAERGVFSISAWSPPPSLLPVPDSYPYGAYFVPRCNIWGWATWRDRWERVDWNIGDYSLFKANGTLRNAFNQGGNDLSAMLDMQMNGGIDTWDIRMDYNRFKFGCLGLNPAVSYTTNIGMGSGTHTIHASNRLDNDIGRAIPEPELPDHIFVDSGILGAYRKSYDPPPLLVRAINRGSRLLWGKNLIQA